MNRLTADQFEALASLFQSRSAGALEAARLVMVEGCAVGVAARQAGVSVQSASNAVSLLTLRLGKCRRAAGVASG